MNTTGTESASSRLLNHILNGTEIPEGLKERVKREKEAGLKKNSKGKKIPNAGDVCSPKMLAPKRKAKVHNIRPTELTEIRTHIVRTECRCGEFAEFRTGQFAVYVDNKFKTEHLVRVVKGVQAHDKLVADLVRANKLDIKVLETDTTDVMPVITCPVCNPTTEGDTV